jgi:hypothetical protein
MIITRKKAKELLGEEAISKPKFHGKRWFLLSRSLPHRNLGGFRTKAEAQEHEHAVQYFKHQNPGPKEEMRKKLRKNVSGELKPRPKSKRIRREAVLGAKGIKGAVEAGKVVCLDTLIFPRPQVVGVTLKSYRDRSGPGADYYGLLRLDSGKTQRLDGLKRTRVIIIDEAQANPMMSTADAAGRTMTVFKLSGAEKKLLERRGIDPWDLVGQRPESLQRMISGLQASERADVAGVGATVFQTAGGPQAVPATLQGMIGSTFKGWTLKDLKAGEGLLPLSARLEREVQGQTVKLRVLPIGSDPSQQLLVIRTGASKAVAKLIRAKRGAAYDLKDVEKVLTRAADEATKWLSGKGRGWKAHEASAVPNPKKPSKKELFKFWAQEFDAELKDEEHRRESGKDLAKAKEDVILWLAGEPGVKPQAEYYNTVVRQGDDTELTIMAIRSLIKAGAVKKAGKGKQATLILTPVGARYAMALEKQLESRALEMGIGPDYDENPKRKKNPTYGIYDGLLLTHARALADRIEGPMKRDLEALWSRGTFDQADQTRYEAALTIFTKNYLNDLARLSQSTRHSRLLRHMASLIQDQTLSGGPINLPPLLEKIIAEESDDREAKLLAAALNIGTPTHYDFSPRSAADLIEKAFPAEAPKLFTRRARNLLSLLKSAGVENNPKKRKSRKNGAKKAAKKKAREAKGRARPYPWDKNLIAKSPFKSKAAAQRAETLHKMGESIGSTQLSSLRAMGRLPRSDGRYELGKKYR